MERQFTATVYIIENKKVLLIYHRKLKKWLPPGGHIDPNETPPDAAIREAREETGLDVELISQENVWVDGWNSKSIERPYMCLLENIPSFDNKPAHQHIDMIFQGRPIGGKIKQNPRETIGIRWFTLEEIKQLQLDEDIFNDTLEAIRSLLKEEIVVGS